MKRNRATSASDIMSRQVITVSPEATLRDAITLFAERHISGAPVVSAGRVLGVISASDILAFEAAGPSVPTGQPVVEQGELLPADVTKRGMSATGTYFAEPWADTSQDVQRPIVAVQDPEWDVLTEHTVAEVMTQGARGVAPDLTLRQVATYLLHHQIHRVLVLEGHTLVGIVTTSDIVRAVAQGRD